MNSLDEVDCGVTWFVPDMVVHCGNNVTIREVFSNYYKIIEDECDYCWTDDMFEGLADEETYSLHIEKDWDENQEITIRDGYEFQDENGNVINTKKITLVKKKPKYPTTYKECCDIIKNTAIVTYGHKSELIYNFHKLLVCRDAYWKIAGGWKPDWKKNIDKYNLIVYEGDVIKDMHSSVNHVLSFPTEEMRDTFYENFKELINECKELL